MNTKLILCEGIPGSGKSSTAEYIAESLRSRGIPFEVYSEGNLNHPADCESMAYFTPEQFDEFVLANGKYESILRETALIHEQHVLLSYGKLRTNRNMPTELINQIRKFEVYELPSETYCELLLQRWSKFVEWQENRDTVVIFECCFLQNPMCKLLVQHNHEPDYIFSYINDLSHVIAKLDPLLVYLNPRNISETINRVRMERSSEWLDFVVWYHTQQEYGRTRGLQGVDGYVRVLESRRELELDILERIPLNVLRIDDPQIDWPESHRKIQGRMEIKEVRHYE